MHPLALKKVRFLKTHFLPLVQKKIFPYIKKTPGLSNQWDKIVVRFALTIYPYSLCVGPIIGIWGKLYLFNMLRTSNFSISFSGINSTFSLLRFGMSCEYSLILFRKLLIFAESVFVLL